MVRTFMPVFFWKPSTSFCSNVVYLRHIKTCTPLDFTLLEISEYGSDAKVVFFVLFVLLLFLLELLELLLVAESLLPSTVLWFSSPEVICV